MASVNPRPLASVRADAQTPNYAQSSPRRAPRRGCRGKAVIVPSESTTSELGSPRAMARVEPRVDDDRASLADAAASRCRARADVVRDALASAHREFTARGTLDEPLVSAALDAFDGRIARAVAHDAPALGGFVDATEAQLLKRDHGAALSNLLAFARATAVARSRLAVDVASSPHGARVHETTGEGGEGGPGAALELMLLFPRAENARAALLAHYSDQLTRCLDGIEGRRAGMAPVCRRRRRRGLLALETSRRSRNRRQAPRAVVRRDRARADPDGAREGGDGDRGVLADARRHARGTNLRPISRQTSRNRRRRARAALVPLVAARAPGGRVHRAGLRRTGRVPRGRGARRRAGRHDARRGRRRRRRRRLGTGRGTAGKEDDEDGEAARRACVAGARARATVRAVADGFARRAAARSTPARRTGGDRRWRFAIPRPRRARVGRVRVETGAYESRCDGSRSRPRPRSSNRCDGSTSRRFDGRRRVERARFGTRAPGRFARRPPSSPPSSRRQRPTKASSTSFAESLAGARGIARRGWSRRARRASSGWRA